MASDERKQLEALSIYEVTHDHLPHFVLVKNKINNFSHLDIFHTESMLGQCNVFYFILLLTEKRKNVNTLKYRSNIHSTSMNHICDEELE